MDKETRKGIQGTKRNVYKRTNASSTRLRQKMRMEADVSDYATGEILSMKCKDRR